MKISEAIKEIIKLKGLVIFNDYKRFKGFLADFSTDTHKRELDVFKNAVDENMLKMCIDDRLEEHRKILKLQIQLENKGLSQDWINFIIESFALSLGWNYTPNPTNQQPQKQNTSSSQNEWTCSCGCVNTTNFCGDCGSAKPAPMSLDWTCVCGTVNTTKFCTTCGKQKGQQQAQQVQKQKTSIQQKPLSQQQQNVKQQITKQTQTQQSTTTKKAQQQGNPFKNAKVGDYVKFGNYPQTSDGSILPIEWQVLAKENHKMLVISKYGLEAKRFDSSSNNWEKSEIRQWLNGEFYNKAFDENERKLIIQSFISTAVYKEYEDLGFFQRLFSGQKEGELGEYSELTDDYIFLLSAEELKYVKELRCFPTEYVIKNDDRSRSWWLRSPNPFFDGKRDVNCVSHVGFIMEHYSVYNDLIVRPAMWLNI